MPGQHVLHLDGVDVEASADDHILGAAHHPHVAALVAGSQIAGPAEAVAQSGRSRVGIPPVLAEEFVAAHDDLTRLAVGHLPPGRVDQAHLHAGNLPAHRVEQTGPMLLRPQMQCHRHLGPAVHMVQPDLGEGLHGPRDQIGCGGGAAVGQGPQGRDVALEGRLSQQHLEHGRRQQARRRPLLLGQPAEEFGLEAAGDDGCARREAVLDRHPVAGRDRHRPHEQVAVEARQALVQHRAGSAGGQRPVRDHDPLRDPGGAPGETDGGGRLGVGPPTGAVGGGRSHQTLVAEAVAAVYAHHRARCRRGQLSGQLRVVGVANDHPGLNLLDDGGQLNRCEPLVERGGQHSGGGGGMEELVVLEAVVGQHRRPLPRLDLESGAQRVGQSPHPAVERLPGEPALPVDHRLGMRVLAGVGGRDVADDGDVGGRQRQAVAPPSTASTAPLT